jgi:hypothetical protein
MDELMAASEAERRFALTVFGVFAAAALVLSALGRRRSRSSRSSCGREWRSRGSVS